MTSSDVTAGVIAEAVAERSDMSLLERRPLPAHEVEAFLGSVPTTTRCAVVIVGRLTETSDFAERWLAARAGLVVMDVDLVGDTARVAVRAARLDPLLTALRDLVESVAANAPRPIRLVEFSERQVPQSTREPERERPLLAAAIQWVHVLLRDAVDKVPDENGDVHGLSVTRATLLQSLDGASDQDSEDRPRDLVEAEKALDRALAEADPRIEPLAAAHRVFEPDPVEFRTMVLALAPELDLRFQRCIGFLLDEMSRRTGTISLYTTLLGPAARVRTALARGNALAQWLVFDGFTGRPPAADEPLRLDPLLAQWILGDRSALEADPRVRRALQLVPWSGALLLQRGEEESAAEGLVTRLQNMEQEQWVLLPGDDQAGWRALLELGARDQQLIRVELPRLAGADVAEVEDCARRIGRMARLTGSPLVIDVTGAESGDQEEDWLILFLATLTALRCRGAVICADAARGVRLLGSASYVVSDEPSLPRAARAEAVRIAAAGAGAYLTEESAEAMANRYPLGVDRLESAMRLASIRQEDRDSEDPSLARFAAALREVAGEGVSHLAERIEPIFSLDQVVLPPDRKEQLHEIVDHVRLAPKVLDEWRFGAQLPYGRGVAALFHGLSGTGKTMAAMAIARRLGIQLLRLDLSRIVSKFIGDTEKNIDRVFTDAQRCGAAILIDEADALLGKRSEVKDAHDRYANIEVAYLLQRMEAYEGLAILTTNMRQNLDSAFLRRLRFVVDFPRPSVEARQQIWRQCLPEGSHELDEAAFRQLARKIDLTGGHIRQITLRAAFLAAAAGVDIRLEHVIHAARAELAKLGIPPVEIDRNLGRKAA